MNLKRLESLDVQGRKALLLFDSCQSAENKNIDPLQIRLLGATLELLVNRGATVFLLTHFQQAHNEVAQKEMHEQIATEIKASCQIECAVVIDPFTDGNRLKLKNAGPGRVFLLENLANFPDEIKGKKEFARELASLADIMIHEAPGLACQPLASAAHLSQLMDATAGLHLQSEIEEYTGSFKKARKPIVFILGGVQVGPKIQLLRKIMPAIQQFMICGGIAATFLKGRALPIGNSSYEKTEEVNAFQILEKAELNETEYILPVDHIAAEQFSRQAKSKSYERIPDHHIAMDSGNKTISAFEKAIKKAGTIYWHGPAGVIEFDNFKNGTRNLARVLKKSRARKIVMGEQTVHFLAEEKLLDAFNHISYHSQLPYQLLSGKMPDGLQGLFESQ